MIVSAMIVLALASTPEWSVQVDNRDVTVWSRDNEASGLREIKARMSVKASPERVWSVLADVEKHTAFMPHLLESKIVDREDDGAIFLYQRISPPFVDDRDYTVRVINTPNPATSTYEQVWTTANHRGPAATDAIRLAHVEGAWTVEPDGAGGSVVTYWVHTSPGGSIPAWIVSAANRKGIPELLLALRGRVTGYAAVTR